MGSGPFACPGAIHTGLPLSITIIAGHRSTAEGTEQSPIPAHLIHSDWAGRTGAEPRGWPWDEERGRMDVLLKKLESRRRRSAVLVGVLELKRAKRANQLGNLSATQCYPNKETLQKVLTDREKHSSHSPHSLTSVAEHSSWKQPLCIFHSPSALLLYSWDGSYFQFNERGEHTALHWTQMGPQRVPNQFLLDKGKNKSRDVYGSDEM